VHGKLLANGNVLRKKIPRAALLNFAFGKKLKLHFQKTFGRLKSVMKTLGIRLVGARMHLAKYTAHVTSASEGAVTDMDLKL
jgi:hypothetical protein